jgi:guanylate kinase
VSKASYELSFKTAFDHIVVNDDLPKAQKQAEDIVTAFL